MEHFKQAFKDNFYLSKQYSEFCSKVTGIELKEKKLENQKIYLLKKKNISINAYSKKFCKKMKKEGINYMTVLPEVNNQTERASFIEYSLVYKKKYEDAVKNYKRSFKDGLKQGKTYLHKVRIIRNYNKNLIAEIYEIYKKQMKRLNSFIFPQEFFKEFMKLKSSFLFLVEYNKKIIAYSFCFENQQNLYTSIGGGNPDSFKYKCVNKLYDELIKYACEKKLNLHLGLGQKGTGYNKFKENAGAINYKCERHPNDELMLKMTTPLLKFKLTGKILQYLSRKFPKKVVYMQMPFT